MPYVTEVVTRDGLPMTYDSGDYPEWQRRALAAAGWSDFPARQEAARQQGRFIGLGLVELCRRHRPRPVRERERAHRPVGQDRRRDRRHRSGPGHPHHAGAARRRGVRRAARPRAGDRRRHRRLAARPRRLCQPPGGDRGQRVAHRVAAGRRQGEGRWRPPCSKSRPTISNWSTARCACAACPA